MAEPTGLAKRANSSREPPTNRILQKQKQQLQHRRMQTPQRFVMDSEDEEPSGAGNSGALRFVTVPPKLVTSKSEGRANKLPSKRRQLPLHFQSERPMPRSEPTPSPTPDSTHNQQREESLSRQKLARRYFRERNRSGSISSASSHDEAAAAAFGQGLMSSSTFSSSAVLTDDMLVAVARRAKKKLEAVAKRHVMVGRWKRMTKSKPDCQMFESVSKAKDQYSVVVKMNLPCSLREIMSVFSTDNAAEFHRSMEALFGDHYVYGVNVRSVDCSELRGAGNSTLRSRAQGRRASEPAVWRTSDMSGAAIPPLRSAKLKLNAVSLMQKHRLAWKQRSMTFLDYLEEKIETKSVTRVMETMDMTDEDLEFSSATMSSPTAASSSQEGYYHLPLNQQGIDPRQEIKGILAGYVIQEDSEEKFTRFFFYATHHHHPTGNHAQTKMPRCAVQLLRAMVNKVCLLETVVLRRRLGYYPLSRLPSSSDEANMASYCATCYTPFSLLRKKFFCRLCGHYTCRKCSDLQDIEKNVGLVEKHRICVSCVRRVSYCVFSMCAFPPKIASAGNSNSWASNRTQASSELIVEDEDDPPIMDDLATTDIEDVEVITPKTGVIAEYLSGLLHGKQEKKRDHVADRRNRLQLTIDDLSSWPPGPIIDGQNTPKESISLLDSFCTSHSSTGSRSRELTSWLTPSPTGA